MAPPARDLAAELAQTVASVFADAEQRLLAALARQISDDVRAQHTDLLAAYEQIRTRSAAVLAEVRSDAGEAARDALLAAFAAGARTAVDQLFALGGATGAEVARLRNTLPGIDAIMALLQELVQRFQSTHLRVLRWQQDAYRDAVTAPTVGILSGTRTRLQATQDMWDDLAARGITGFVDASGRGWNLTSYAEMATRTASSHAELEGHVGQLLRMGAELAQVTDSPEECEICRPWEGEVVALVGPAGPRQVEHALEDGLMVTVDVKGTLADAIEDGLFHPNCTHRLRAYLPGVTRTPRNTANPQGYEDRQELRRLEREVRKAKREEAAAITEAARRKHGRKVRDLQRQIREHVATTSAVRRPDREQLDPAFPDFGDDFEPDLASRREIIEAREYPPPAEPLPDLASLSDDALFALFNERSESGDPAELESILAELERRDEPDPAPEADPLDGINLEGLGASWLDHYEREYAGRPDVLDRINTERQRRADELAAREERNRAAQAPPIPVDADPGVALDEDEELTPEQARVDELVDAGWEWEEAYAEVYNVDRDELDRQARNAMVDAERAAGESREDTVRRLYREYTHVQYLAAEDHTRGHMLNFEGRAQGIDPLSLFSGPVARARKYGSDDLLEWFAENGRMTFTQFKAEVLGRDADVKAAEVTRFQSNAQDYI